MLGVPSKEAIFFIGGSRAKNPGCNFWKKLLWIASIWLPVSIKMRPLFPPMLNKEVIVVCIALMRFPSITLGLLLVVWGLVSVAVTVFAEICGKLGLGGRSC